MLSDTLVAAQTRFDTAPSVRRGTMYDNPGMVQTSPQRANLPDIMAHGWGIIGDQYAHTDDSHRAIRPQHGFTCMG